MFGRTLGVLLLCQRCCAWLQAPALLRHRPLQSSSSEDDEPEDIDVSAEWLRFRRERNLTLEDTFEEEDDDPPPRRTPKEVIGGVDASPVPRFLSDEREERREVAFLDEFITPKNFERASAVVGAIALVYLAVFLTGGITSETKYAPGFDGTSESFADVFGAVLPSDGPPESDGFDLAYYDAGSGPVV